MKRVHPFLYYFLAGGGLRNMGKTAEQEQAKKKHCRFLFVAGVFFAIWLVLYLT